MSYPGRLGLQQRVLPSYRVPFFDMLASACEGGLSLFAGQPRAEESIDKGNLRIAGYAPAHNVHLFRGSLYICYQRSLPGWLSSWNPDALIVEANPRYLSTPAAIKWMSARGSPVIGWGLGASAITGPISFFRKWAWKWFLNQFDALIAYSQRGADEYAASGFPERNIFVAHNAVSTAPSAKPLFKRTTVDRLSILFVGRLQARKRIDWLIRACAQVSNKPSLVIVGDGPVRKELEDLARVVFPDTKFIGAMHGDRLKSYFAEADLFVLPGTGGLAVQQAMSYALPVIVAQGDGTQEDLVNKRNGWLIPSGDFNALVACIQEALSDRSRLRKMGDESYSIVSQEINLEKMVEAFINALNSVS